MGKGTIRENLGEGHYRVALDIDVSYAREQLAAIKAYLDEFQTPYQEAVERKEQAKAALTPINDRLSAYLSTAQAESETAYAAMQSAYTFWRDLSAAQPAGEAVSFLRQALTEAAKGFDAAHAEYHDALLNSDNPNLPSPADAWQQRNEALIALALAQGQWSGSVGPISDETAVNAAYDQVGIALDAFNAATLAYAEAVASLSSDQALRLSSMNFQQGEFTTAQSEWIKSVEENSGLILLQRAREAYDQATAEFESKQKALASLLDNGGMPAELARIQTDLEKAYKDYRIVLDEVQSLTLLKVEKQTARDDLLSKLLPFTDADGVTEKPPVVAAWCADMTDTLSPNTPVATVEIPGERQLGLRIRPQFGQGNGYTAARDGRLQSAFSSSPEATFWNWALHPGAEKWRPRYRLGRILAIDPAKATCTVALDPQSTGDATRARDGQVLDVNSPLKIVVDPQTGHAQSVLPGPNLQIQNGITTLLNVPIQYMDCGADAFAVKDAVLVEFIDRDWTQPRVIGFADHPRPCQQPGILLTADNNGQSEQLFLKDSSATTAGTTPELKHPLSPKQGGNLDWTSPDRKTVITFDGPLGRAIPPAVAMGALGDSLYGDFSAYSVTSVQGLVSWQGSPLEPADEFQYRVCQRFGRVIYKNGKPLATAPFVGESPPWPSVVLGAAQLSYQDAHLKKTYLVAALIRPLSSVGVLTRAATGRRGVHHPECIDPMLAWADIQSGPITAKDWHLLPIDPLSTDPTLLPPTGACFFSGSGRQFACLLPTIAGPNSRYPGCDDHTLLQGTLRATADGVQLDSLTVTRQSASGHYDFAGYYHFDYPAVPDHPGGIDEYWTVVGFNDRKIHGHSSAIVAIDFIGETAVTLTSDLSHQVSFREDWNVFSDRQGWASNGMNQTEIRQKTSLEQETLTASVTDSHRSLTISDVRLTRSKTRAIGVNISTPNGQAGYHQFSEADQDISLSVHRPLFYDLRTGAAVYADMNYARHQTDVMDEPGHLGVFGLADGGTRTMSWSDRKNFGLKISDTHGTRHDTWDWHDHAGDTEEVPTVILSEDHWLDVGGVPPINASGVHLEHSASSTYAVPWLRETEPGQRDRYAPLTLYCQTANPSGDLVARGRFSVNLEWMEAYSILLPRFYHALTPTFASHFDLETAWQAHLKAQHPQKEGEASSTMTAEEAGVTPRFRV